jgi:hypothetical protein
VVNDGSKNYDNKQHTIMGYKGAFQTVIVPPADTTEF